MTATIADLSIANLATALGPREEETRVLGSRVIGIAGPFGFVRGDLGLLLSLERMSADARLAAADLYDAGAIDAHPDGKPFIARMPANAVELKLLRRALGLKPRRSEQ